MRRDYSSLLIFLLYPPTKVSLEHVLTYDPHAIGSPHLPTANPLTKQLELPAANCDV